MKERAALKEEERIYVRQMQTRRLFLEGSTFCIVAVVSRDSAQQGPARRQGRETVINRYSTGN